MKKYFFSIGLFLIFFTARSQEFNKIIFDTLREEEIICGYCDRAGLTTGQFNSWFGPEYESYTVDDTTLDALNIDLLSLCKIKVVLGTWCSDSQREVPRFMKILDYLGLPDDNLEFICVDRSKNAEGTEVADLDIERVPTIIFYLGDKELGRIIESPEVSLEVDMSRILEQ